MSGTIYHLDSSGRLSGSVSRGLSRSIAQMLASKHQSSIRYRDLSQGLPFLDEVMISGLFIKESERTTAQKQALSTSVELVRELQEADYLVLGLPIYNFGVPASVKAWADQVARSGITFHFKDGKPEGLLEIKKAYVVVASGGTKVGSEIDFATSWLRHFLGFIGIKDVEILNAKQAEALLQPVASRGYSLPKASI